MSEGAGPAGAVEQRAGGREAGGPRAAWLGGRHRRPRLGYLRGSRGATGGLGELRGDSGAAGHLDHAVSPVDRVGKESFATTISDAGWE